MLKHLARVLATIAHTAHPNSRYLPAVQILYLSNSHLKTITNPRQNRLNDLSLLLQRVTFGKMQRDLTGTYNHGPSIS